MKDLIFLLIGDALKRDILLVSHSLSRFRKIAYVLESRLVFDSCAQNLRQLLSSQIGTSVQTHPDELTQSMADHLLICVEPPKNAILYETVFAPTSSDLIRSPARAIAQVIEYLGATEFLDLFEVKMVRQLTELLRYQGLEEFLSGVLFVLRAAGENGCTEVALEKLGNWQRTGSSPKSQAHLRKVFEPLHALVMRSKDPHQSLKAMLSLYVYLLTNRNVSETARKLGITRSTVTSHVELAKRLNLTIHFSDLNTLDNKTRG